MIAMGAKNRKTKPEPRRRVAEMSDQEITEALNKVYARTPAKVDPVLAIAQLRSLDKSGGWE